MRQKKLVGVLLAVALVGAMASRAKAQDARKVLVAYAGLISTHTSLWLGEDQGFYKKHGLNVTSVFISSGSVTSQALIAGEAKLASTSVGPTAGAVSGGADLVILAGTIHILPYQFWVLPSGAPARRFERQASCHQHLRLGEPPGSRSRAALSRLGSHPGQDRHHASRNPAGSSSGPCKRQDRCDASGAGLWAGRKR